jgi:hypothetical protein
MTKEEFCNAYKAVGGNPDLIDLDTFNMINDVYRFHPSIKSGTQGITQMACLAASFGMTAIEDLWQRAVRIKDTTESLREARDRVKQLEKKLKELREEYDDEDQQQ